MDVPSVEQLAIGRIDSGERTVNLLRRIDPQAIPDLAIDFLKREGVPLIGAPELVEYAKARATEVIEGVFDLLDAERAADARKVGRPRARPEHDLVLMAAFYKFSRKGLGPTAARHEAAKLLGTTSSRIEKAVKRFLRHALILERRTGRSLEVVCRLQAKFVYSTCLMIDECVEERRAMMARTRRY